MAGVPIVIVGTIKDNDSDTEKQVTITGICGLQGFYPDHGLPGQPPGIWGGPIDPYPGHPLPEPGPGRPPGIWGGGNRPFPTPPIANVPGLPPMSPGGGGGGPDKPLFDWKVGWTPDTGWVVVAIPKFEHPAPSATTKSPTPPKS